MNPTIDSLIVPSVSLWLDNLLIEKFNGFYNVSAATLTKVSSPLNGLFAWASPDRQWVYDSSIGGVQVPSGITKNAVFTPRSASLILNFLQGGIWMTSNTSQPITADYSKKEVNVYISNDALQTVLFEKKYSANPSTTSSDPKNVTDFIYPCIIITTSAGDNNTLDFAGNVSTLINMRLIFMADNAFLYQTVCGAIRDQKEVHIPIFNADQLPFNEYGDLRAAFDYSALASNIQQDAGRLAYLKDVTISKFPSVLTQQMGLNTFGAFIDLDLEVLRFPR